jgi:hypothetical protein
MLAYISGWVKHVYRSHPEFTGYSVEVEMADPDRLRLGRHYTPTGMYTYARP